MNELRAVGHCGPRLACQTRKTLEISRLDRFSVAKSKDHRQYWVNGDHKQRQKVEKVTGLTLGSLAGLE